MDGRAGLGVERDGGSARKRLVLRVLEPGGTQAANHRHSLESVGYQARHGRQGKKQKLAPRRIGVREYQRRGTNLLSRRCSQVLSTSGFREVLRRNKTNRDPSLELPVSDASYGKVVQLKFPKLS